MAHARPTKGRCPGPLDDIDGRVLVLKGSRHLMHECITH